ncbi:hypothetical protein ACJ41O_007606 [Fusarium nematophilum]
MQRCQNGRSRAEGNSIGQSSSTEQLPSSSSRQQSGDGQRKRKERTDSGDTSGESGSSTTVKRKKGQRQSEEPECPRPFACPFCKKELRQYQSCARFGFKKVRHVKQHVLHRSHGHEIEPPTKERLRQRSARGISKEEQWYEIFETLFPGHLPRPASPYNDFRLSEQPAPASQPLAGGIPLDEALYIPAEYLTGPGAEVIQRAVIEDPAFSRLSEDTIRSALNRGLSLVLESFLEHRWEQLVPAQVAQTSAESNTVGTNNPEIGQTFDERGSYNSDAYLNGSSGIPGGQSWTVISHPSTPPLPTHDRTGGDNPLGQELRTEKIADEGSNSPNDPFFSSEQVNAQDPCPHEQGGQDADHRLDMLAASNGISQDSQQDIDVGWLLDPHYGDEWQYLDGDVYLGQSSSTLPLDEPQE